VNVALLIWLFGAKSQMELQFPPTLFETLLATPGSFDALQFGPVPEAWLVIPLLSRYKKTNVRWRVSQASRHLLKLLLRTLFIERGQ
jgi:hypothetical protein